MSSGWPQISSRTLRNSQRLDGSPMIYNRRDPYLPDFLMCRTELADVLLDGIGSAYRER